jgi:hypothetical protein
MIGSEFLLWASRYSPILRCRDRAHSRASGKLRYVISPAFLFVDPGIRPALPAFSLNESAGFAGMSFGRSPDLAHRNQSPLERSPRDLTKFTSSGKGRRVCLFSRVLWRAVADPVAPIRHHNARLEQLPITHALRVVWLVRTTGLGYASAFR